MNLILKFRTYKHKDFVLAVLLSLITYLIFYGDLIKPDYYFWEKDAKSYYIPARFYFYEKVVTENTFPFWTERLYLGFPVFADIEMGYWHFLNLFLILIFGPLFSYKVMHLLFYLIGSISLYLLLKKYQINLWGFFTANLIFYFNFFMNLHQIHYNVVLTFYLFPLSIYLIELYFEKNRFSLILYQSLAIASGFLLGHTQSFFIYVLGIVIYFVLKLKKDEFISKFLIYFSLVGILLLILSLPQIIPTYEVYTESLRRDILNYKQGSLIPSFTSLIFLPNPLGNLNNYQGFLFNQNYLEFETYIYIGISTFLLFLFSYFSKGNLFYKKYTLITLYIFIFLATIGSNGFFEDQFLISLFRYWQRIVILFIFGVAIMCAYIISNYDKIKFSNFKNKIFILIPLFVYLYILDIFGANQDRNLLFINLMFKNLNIWFILIAVVSLVTLVLLVPTKISSRFKYYLSFLILFIIIFDLHFFSKPHLNFYIRRVNIEWIKSDANKYKNERILLNSKTDGLENLYLKSWSVFGFSNFIAKEYLNYLQQNNLKPEDEHLRYKLDFEKKPDNLKILGIKYVLNDVDYKKIYYQNLELFDENLKARYLTKEEGNISVKYFLEKDSQINSKIRYSNNWEVKINNQKIDYFKKDIFLSFNAPKGENILEIKYIPRSFYWGVYGSIILLLVLVVLVKQLKRLKYLS